MSFCTCRPPLSLDEQISELDLFESFGIATQLKLRARTTSALVEGRVSEHRWSARNASTVAVFEPHAVDHQGAEAMFITLNLVAF